MRWSRFLLSLERIRMQTAGLGVQWGTWEAARAYGGMLPLLPSIRWGSGKRAAKAYGGMLPLLPSIPWGSGKRAAKAYRRMLPLLPSIP